MESVNKSSTVSQSPKETKQKQRSNSSRQCFQRLGNIIIEILWVKTNFAVGTRFVLYCHSYFFSDSIFAHFFFPSEERQEKGGKMERINKVIQAPIAENGRGAKVSRFIYHTVK